MPRSRWYCASLSVGYDLVTASFSVADMVCDYLVLLQFYTDGRPVFFALSLVVMLLAHATYACLFTQKYVPDHTTNQHGRIVAVFLAALPVSQFVPLFIYLDANGSGKRPGYMLSSLGLEPPEGSDALSRYADAVGAARS